MAPSPDVPWHERRLQSYNVHKQHYFLDQFPESRKMMMQLHAKRAARYEYLQPKGTPGGENCRPLSVSSTVATAAVIGRVGRLVALVSLYGSKYA